MLTSEFASEVRRQGKVSVDVTDADILAFGDSEVRALLLWVVKQSKQEYGVREATVQSVAGRVPLPMRAVLGGVRHVQLVSGSGFYSLPRVEPEDDMGPSLSGGVPSGFYFDAGGLVLWPRGVGGTVRLKYVVRPGRMGLNTDAALFAQSTASSVIGADGSATLALPANTIPTGLVDVIGSGPAHEHCAVDVSFTAGISCPVTAGQSLGAMRIGDYVCVADRTPVVPLPEEASAALVHRTAGVYLRAAGYDSEATVQLTLAEECKKDLAAALAPRTEGPPRFWRGGISSQIHSALWGWR